VEEREIIIPYTPEWRPLSAVRSIVIHSSLNELKALGHFDRYREPMATSAYERLGDYLGPSWVPVELAIAHYEACDSMHLTNAQLEEMGRRVGDRLQGSLLVTLSRTARSAGFTPWLAMAPIYRMARRTFQGTIAQFVKLGPKELQVEILGNPLMRYQYYRTAYCAATRVAFSVLGTRVAYVKFAGYRTKHDETHVRVSWV